MDINYILAVGLVSLFAYGIYRLRARRKASRTKTPKEVNTGGNHPPSVK